MCTLCNCRRCTIRHCYRCDIFSIQFPYLLVTNENEVFISMKLGSKFALASSWSTVSFIHPISYPCRPWPFSMEEQFCPFFMGSIIFLHSNLKKSPSNISSSSAIVYWCHAGQGSSSLGQSITKPPGGQSSSPPSSSHQPSHRLW